MKKFFTLLCAIAAAVVVNASTVDVVTTQVTRDIRQIMGAKFRH